MKELKEGTFYLSYYPNNTPVSCHGPCIIDDISTKDNIIIVMVIIVTFSYHDFYLNHKKSISKT